jgi:RimJ/RimL family protein N-acetyltransferase
VIEVDDHVIGHCALFHLDAVAQTAEMGITIGDKGYWGKGYGRDAIALLLGYGFRLLNLQRIWLKVHAGNERAIRAYRACGFVQEGRFRRHVWSNGSYDDVLLMGVLREEWEK